MSIIKNYKLLILTFLGLIVILGALFFVVPNILSQEVIDNGVEAEEALANPSYQEGVLLHAEGKYLDAIAQFDLAIESEPEVSNFYVSRAGSYYLQAQFDKTLADLDKAIEIDPENAAAYLMRGSVRLDTFAYDPFDYEAGLNDLYRYLELEPRSEFRQVVEETIERYETD